MSLRFCERCDNMLYPKEVDKKLVFFCRGCQQSFPVKETNAESNLVYRNEVKLGESQILIDPGIVNDPTYARVPETCPKCKHGEAIYFQNPNINDPGMKFILVCCGLKEDGENCGYWWYKKEKNDNEMQIEQH